jgi:hypothetical protein
MKQVVSGEALRSGLNVQRRSNCRRTARAPFVAFFVQLRSRYALLLAGIADSTTSAIRRRPQRGDVIVRRVVLQPAEFGNFQAAQSAAQETCQKSRGESLRRPPVDQAALACLMASLSMVLR